MAESDWSDEELLGFLDELVSPETMSAIEKELRNSESLRTRLGHLVHRRDSGTHSLGEIWRRNRLSCPSRETLGSYLLRILDRAESQYVDFHLKTVGCRYCLANLDDLQQAETSDRGQAAARRKRVFESSAGWLHSDESR